MTNIGPTYILAGCALAILGIIAVALVFFPVPQGNQQIITFITGAISGALTVGAGTKVADKITNSVGPDATIQPETGK